MPKRSNGPPQCSISGCGKLAPRQPDKQTPPKLVVRVCTFHAVAIWRQVQLTQAKSAFVTDLLSIEDAIEVELPTAPRSSSAPPPPTREWIYFVALNDLIKVGWSSQLRRRLKAYGPSVQVLCHYPGSRKDETELHQILTPFRAKGREWYTDSPMIRNLIAEKIEQHGAPSIQADWTEPPNSGVKPKRWAA